MLLYECKSLSFSSTLMCLRGSTSTLKIISLSLLLVAAYCRFVEIVSFDMMRDLENIKKQNRELKRTKIQKKKMLEVVDNNTKKKLSSRVNNE